GLQTPVWTKFGALPNVIVTDLHYIAPDAAHSGQGDVLLAGTLGRGAWTVPNASALFAIQSSLIITGSSSNHDIKLARNATNPLLLDVLVNGVRPSNLPKEIPISSL